ncbi:MAG: DUF3604 domain-containing protein [Acidobacteria bacterium]|nr:DUF3604 domain-containing protein [Acidobacteriota bacterium]
MKRTTFFLTTVLLLATLARLRSTGAQDRPAGSDYLSPELRQAVERLKREAAVQPTDTSNAVERGKILWDWINAYSLTGGPVPVNATQQLAAVFALDAGERENLPPSQGQSLPKAIDALIYEFRIKDEKPAALPAVSLSTRGPLPASSYQTIQQTITVGDMPFQHGAVILIGKQIMSDSSIFQNREPKADNYLSVRTSRPGARFTPISAPLSGMHGGFRGTADMPAFRLEGTLSKADTVTITYGDRVFGSRGMRLQTFANDRVLLPVYVDPEANGIFLTPVWPGFAVEGNQASAVRLIAPSVVKTGEAFELAIRAEDNLWNRARGQLPASTLTLNGNPLRELPARSDAVTVIRDLKIDRPGTYRIRMQSTGGTLSGESNPIWVEDSPSRRIYWGETHAHSGMAEGQGSIDGFYRYGRDDARLDFLGLSEHDIWLDDNEWRQMQEAVRRYTEPGRFIAFLGYEWTAQRTSGGHHNVFFRDPDKKRVPVAKAWTLSLLYQGLRSIYSPRDVLIIPHAHQAGDWRRNDPDLERLVEIMSMHGTFEWFGNYYLKRGYDTGFVAASDDHRTRPGLSGAGNSPTLAQFGGLVAVSAAEKTAPAIFDALRDRATCAVTSADRILLDVNLNSTRPGRRAAFNRDRRMQVRVSGTAPLDRMDIIRNGDIVHTRRFASSALASNSRVEISFESDSEPYIRDNPRGYRTWRGTLELVGGRIVRVHANFDNRHSEFARIDAQNPNLIQFSTATRGRADILELDMEGVSASSEIRLELLETIESGVSPPSVRPMATIPASSIKLPFSQLREGLLIEQIPLGLHTDSVSMQVVGADTPMDAAFEWVEQGQTRPGDYYYVRVRQRNGARAWSSPIWVGGEPAR